MSKDEKAAWRWRRRVWLALTCGALLAFAAQCSPALAVSWGPGVKATLPADAGHDPHGPAPDTILMSVSCPSPGNCGAVGSYLARPPQGGRRGLLLSESGGIWGAGAEATLPADADLRGPGAELRSVSCPSAGECTAVGAYSYDVYAHDHALLVTESGGVWGVGVKALLPADTGSNPDAVLTSVSCPSAGNCTAVGYYLSDSGSGRGRQGLLLTESGGVWATGVKAILPGDASPAPNVDLPSVSCPSAGNCSAAGSYYDKAGHKQGLLLTESGGVWAAGAKPALPADAGSGRGSNTVLSSVSCPSAGKCSAVGTYPSHGSQGLLLRESGGVWGTGFRATLPADAGSAPKVGLSSVSCPSAGNCGAVGSYRDSSDHQQGLLLSESAGAWGPGLKPGLPPNAGSSSYSALNSVSCPSAGNCAAIGNYTDSSGLQGLLVSESGGVWARGVEAPLPDAAPLAFTFANNWSSVSCPAAGKCSAVGSYVDRSHQQQGVLLGTVSGGTPQTLTVAKAGSGGGTVVSSPDGIDCGQSCSAQFEGASAVTLTAVPAPGSVFGGWSGVACTRTRTCLVTMSSEQAATATFDIAPPPDTEITKTHIKGRRAKFNFKAKGNATGFQCELKRKNRQASFTDCRSPQTYARLQPGEYTFKVRATGPGGIDKTPARETFAIER